MLFYIKQGRKICRDCLIDRQEKYLTKIETIGLKPLKHNDYIDKYSEIEWVCCEGHIQKTKAKNIIERNRTNHCICKECKK